MFVQLALAALIAEAILGYPDAVYRRIGHPVTWIGALIARCETAWNSPRSSFARRRLGGIVLVLLLVLLAAGIGALLTAAIVALAPGWPALFVTALLAAPLLAQRSLDTHVVAVARALETDGLDAGRHAVANIVGRDPASLDVHGVSRAAIESLAENFSDAVVAPLVWLAAAGLPGIAAYKAINTADSMVGHRSERYAAFGWAAARLDDLVNLPASRLSAVWLVLAALLVPAASARGAIRALWRDAGRHASPNAGWPEAAMAGALGLRLAGPRSYGGNLVDDHWMGDGHTQATAADIRRAVCLYRLACGLQAATLAAVLAAPLIVAW